MGLLDQLGAGGALALLPTNQQQLQQFSYYPYPEMLANVYQQQKYPLQVCSHPNCLICAKQTKTAQKLKIKQDKVIVKKKLAYEKRCKDYMKKFRRY